MENLAKIKDMLAGLRTEAAKIDQDLATALTRRDELVMMPFPKAELIANLQAAVDAEAEEYRKQFSNHLQYLIRRRGLKRTGVHKSPSVIRDIGSYGELSITALHYYHAKEIKAGIAALVESLDCPDGINDQEYEQELAALNREIESLTAQRDGILAELDHIGKAR